MRKVKSCGVIVFRPWPCPEFLLLRHTSRFDLPKGHSRPGESDLDCALRELEEETGLGAQDIRLDRAFRCEQIYYPRYQSLGGQVVEKRLVMFLGHLLREREVRPSEHVGFLWVPWRPPHRIQERGIDPLLSALERHFERTGGPPGHPYP